MELKKFVVNNEEVKYRNSNDTVLMPTEFKEKNEYFRGAWVTSICDDFKPSPNKEEMQTNLW